MDTTAAYARAAGRTIRLIHVAILGGAVWLIIASLYGIVLAIKLWAPEFLTAAPLSFGRLRPIHTNGVLLGWLTLVFVGLSYLVVHHTTRRPLWSAGLGWAGFGLMNAALLAGTVSLHLGVTRGPLEYREWVTPIAALMAAGVLCHGVNVLMTLVHRRVEEIYIANWFILGAYVWLPILYVVAYLPGFGSGAENLVIQGYYMHVVLGLWFTPLAVGITYWSLPRLLHKPIYSYSLGVLAFWGNLLFYTLIGAHHFILAPTPWWLQSTAILLGLGMLIPVFASVFNFLLTMQGSWPVIRRQPAGWFLLAGTLVYGLVSLQGSVMAFRGFGQVMHFTHYTIGHAHWAAYGFASFMAFGGVYALLPRLTGGAEARDPRRLSGIAIYVVSMTMAGVIQGMTWAANLPFIDSLHGVAPYMLARAVGGTLMTAGHVAFFWCVWQMRPVSATRPAAVVSPDPVAVP
jgi:cytochrome c oxidase cbb3-type subunit 1